MTNQVSPMIENNDSTVVNNDSLTGLPTENFNVTEDPNQPFYSSMFKQPTKRLDLETHPEINEKLNSSKKLFIARTQVQPESKVGFLKHFYNLNGVTLKISILDQEKKKILEASEFRKVFMLVFPCICKAFSYAGTNETKVQINVPDASEVENSGNMLSKVAYQGCFPWDRWIFPWKFDVSKRHRANKQAQFERRWEIKDYENNVIGSIQKLARDPEGNDEEGSKPVTYSTHYSIQDCDGKMIYYIRPEMRTDQLLKNKQSLKKFFIQEIKSQNPDNQRRVSQHAVHRRMSRRITDDRYINAGEIGIFMENASFCTKLADRPIELGYQNDVNRNDYVVFPESCSSDQKIMILQAALMIEFEFTRRALLWGNAAFDVTSMCDA